jgi:hypothetical protein
VVTNVSEEPVPPPSSGYKPAKRMKVEIEVSFGTLVTTVIITQKTTIWISVIR